MSGLRFTNLTITEWKQFEQLDVEFHPRLTVLTGANGSGKTTILNLLSRHFGWNVSEMSTPARDKKTGIIRFFTRYFKTPSTAGLDIGSVKYSDGAVAYLKVPDSAVPNYQIQLQNPSQIQGFYIPEHRPFFCYQPVDRLPTRKRKKREAFSVVADSNKSRALGGSAKPASFHIKETLLAWAVYGYGNEVIERDEEQMQFFKGFQDTLRQLLPPELGFREFSIRESEIVLITKTGDFILDAVSGGISALIDLAWQVYMFSTKETLSFTVLIDEIENHLHASMQRKVLPDLLGAFPHVQFIVASHSPLVVGSVKDSAVYALCFGTTGRVRSERLDPVAKSKGAADVLREILGVPFTMPIWVEDFLVKLVSKYSQLPLTSETLEQLRNELEAQGLGDLAPETIGRVAQSHDDQA